MKSSNKKKSSEPARSAANNLPQDTMSEILSRRQAIGKGAAVAIGAGVIVVGAAGYLAYLSQGGQQATTTTQTVTTTIPTTTTTTSKVTAVLGDVDELGRIDPAVGFFTQDARLYFNIYDPLLFYDNSVPPKVVPWIAKSWEISPDGTEYTFHLRDDVKFHDGTTLTAEDVAFSMNRALAIKTGYAFMWTPIMNPGDASVVDNYTMKMKLKIPFAPFLSTLPFLIIVNSKVVKKNIKTPGPYGDNGDYASPWLLGGGDSGTLTGSGPYKWISRVPGTEDRLERYESYWKGWSDNPRPVDVWLHRRVPEEATLRTLIRTGEVQMVLNPFRTLKFYLDLQKEPNVTVYKAPISIILSQIVMNTTKPPLDDVHIRRALCYAFDYDTYINEIRGGADVRMTSPVGRGYPFVNKDLVPYKFDLSKAEEEIAASKYTKAELSQMEIEHAWTQPIEDRRLRALLLQSGASKVGLNIKLQGLEALQFSERVTKAETNPALNTWDTLGFYADPDSLLYFAFRTTEFHTDAENPSYYSNPEVDKMLEDARKLTDQSKREPIYKKLQEILYNDAPYIWISEMPSFVLLDSRLKGFVYNWEEFAYRMYPVSWTGP